MTQSLSVVLFVLVTVHGFQPKVQRRQTSLRHSTHNPSIQQNANAATHHDEVSPVMAAYDCDARGRELQQRGALNAAIEALAEGLSHHPTPERHFRLGLALAENGEPTRAAEAYRKAWGTSEDPVLCHDACLKLAHVWAHDLGDLTEGIAHADAAMGEEGFAQSAAALDQKAFFLAAQGRIEEAIGLWSAALEGGRAADMGEGVPDDARFFRAVAKALAGHDEEAEADFAALPNERRYMVDSWRYVSAHPPQQDNWCSHLFSGTHSSLANALSVARPDGLVCEFGVFHGKSIRLIASMVGPRTTVDGFDTFEGIPEAWGDEYAAGSYTAASEIPQRVPDNVRFHVGLFADALPGYVASLPPPEVLPVRLINVDCDLYQGTVEILYFLRERIGPGTVIVFDEYLMHPTWRQDEYRAFQEACANFGWEYECLTFSLFSKQAVVRITTSASFVGPKRPEG